MFLKGVVEATESRNVLQTRLSIELWEMHNETEITLGHCCYKIWMILESTKLNHCPLAKNKIQGDSQQNSPINFAIVH